ncbi:uncharacterized protein Gasu_38120 [Galdieria sulphuraria]|uniref:RING-type domain-containing protein n=1 Tax=Galdieria sulphuraria TaxID=130081 RepID=M2XYN8_GALSU|nr:uncharacterized protein Gasu_38120 [Galdieria sulphuraria]EME28763.1 hypothetical protein Gasu_38120 [Galdieria sulphuraria]|eukprot:XP_005705283.1 hypothetical protein Gasu_38120 [Galdieria sulphuraria]
MGNSPSSAVWDFNSNRPLGQYIRRSESSLRFPIATEDQAGNSRRSSGSTRANSASGRSSNTGVSRHVPRRVTRRNRSPSHHSVHRASRTSRVALERLMAETRRMHHSGDGGENKWTETKVKQMVDSKSLAPRDRGTDEPIGENLDECPICFAYFPMLNTTCCCNKALCTNCFLHIQRHGKRKSCPFCNRPKLEVMFFGPRTDEERFLEYVEDISLELRKRASLKDETECVSKKDAVLQTDDNFIQFDSEEDKRSSSLSHLSSSLLERVRNRLVLSNNSDYYETKGLSLQNVCNILQQEEISEEDLAVIIALHRSYMEHKSKSRESSTEKKDESLGGSSHSEHLVDMDEDDSSFLDIFSLSGSSSHLYKPSLSTSCPTHFNQLNQTRCSEDSVATGNSSSRLVDIEDPERSESTTFYLDVPPISPSLHFMSKSQSSETQE